MTAREWRASAPVRLDFAGGWTDVAPFTERHGGVVVNAAIEVRARAGVRMGGSTWVLHSDDLGATAELDTQGFEAHTGALPLHHAALKMTGVGPCRLATRSEAPPGSGLGSSGALDVAMLAALDAARGVRREPAALAEAAFQLEAVNAGLPGGRQDQCAAALGGFHRLQFAGGAPVIQALPLDGDFADWLARRTVLCYTGTSRVSSDTIARVMGRYASGDPEVTGALERMVEVAERMVTALLRADPGQVAALLSRNWEEQQRLDPGMRTPGMARLESALRAEGALGGKAAGAGAGGSMFFIVEGDRERAVRVAQEQGAQVIPFTWAHHGVCVE